MPVETQNPSSFELAFDNTSGLATGLALANAANQAVSVAAIGHSSSDGSVKTCKKARAGPALDALWVKLSFPHT